MLTQNFPARSILGQLVELLSGKKATSGGWSDTDVNEPTTKPARDPSRCVAVTTQTPVGYCPSTWRNHRELVGSLIELWLPQEGRYLPVRAGAWQATLDSRPRYAS